MPPAKSKSTKVRLPKHETREILISLIRDLPTRNPNRMSADMYAALVAGIRKHGNLRPILVYAEDTGFVMCDGVHRRRAMIDLGQTKIEAKIYSCKEDAEEAGRVLRIAMNEIHGASPVDHLAEEVTSMLAAGIDKSVIASAGMDLDEINAILKCGQVDVETLLAEVQSAPTVGSSGSTSSSGRTQHYKLTFEFHSFEEKEAVLRKLSDFSGSPEMALLAALGLE